MGEVPNRRLSKELSRQRYSELRDLWCDWDPIGVMDQPDWPRDEYDTYVGRSMRLLESGASDQEFLEYLEYIVGEYIGLGQAGIDYNRPAEFIKKMRSGYESKWAGTHV